MVVLRRSLDARKKGHARWLVNLEVSLDGPLAPAAGRRRPRPRRRRRRRPGSAPPPARPVILGAGPAGLFCAWGLLERGVPSLVVDRGRTVGPRRRDVAALMRDGTLDPESNMNFGEGGAGAYTDGKLGTGIHHPAVRTVVELFARFGGVTRILAEGKPHVGSDVLPSAISAMVEELTRGGCQFLWGARAVDLELREGRFAGLRLADGRTLDSDRLVLAPGNSARELFELFAARGWPIEAKPFAVGFRAEHPQPLIDSIQYGGATRHPRLPPADYKLADNPRLGGAPRGVFSFCMCPGGVVVPTPTEPGMQCTNGMSNSQPLLAAGQRRHRGGGLARRLRRRGLHRAAGRPGVAAQVGAGRLRARRRRLQGAGAAAGRLPGRQAGRGARGAPATGPASPTPTSSRSTRRRSRRPCAPGCAPSTSGCAASSPTRRC